MSVKPRKYATRNVVSGVIILLMSLNWLYTNIQEYYFWNFDTGWKCGTGAPTNPQIIMQIVLAVAGIITSAFLIKGRLKPLTGWLYHVLLIAVGIYVSFLRYA